MLRRYVVAGMVVVTAMAVAVVLSRIPVPTDSIPLQREILGQEEVLLGSSSFGEEGTAAVGVPPVERLYEEIPAPKPQPGYYIKDWDGRISIVKEGQDTPEMIFDIYTRLLPPYDQEQLHKGLYVASYQELTALIEDYIS